MDGAYFLRKAYYGKRNMKVKSETTNKVYEDTECVFFRNPLQSAYYVSCGAELQDIFVDGRCKFVYVFKKIDHERYIGMWNKINKDRANECRKDI